MRQPPESDDDLIVSIQQHYPDSLVEFGELYTRYARQIYGFIRGRMSADQHAQDIAHETYIQVWEKMPAYDPSIGSFRAFAKYRASIMIMRYYSAQSRLNTLQVLFSELQARFPGLEQEQEIGDLLARLAAHRHPSVEEEQITEADDAHQAIEVREELFRLTFGGASPPHQTLAFGFRQLITEEPDQKPDEEPDQGKPDEGTHQAWPPRRIVDELSDTPLKRLHQRFAKAYVSSSDLPQHRIHTHLAWLRRSMRSTLEDVVTTQRTRATHAALLQHVVGATTFHHYYTHREDPTSDITRWCDAVKRRVWSAVKHQGSGPLFRLLQMAERHKAAYQTDSGDHASR